MFNLQKTTMKNLLLFAFCFSVFIACSSDEDSDGGDIASITMTLDGSAWESSDDGPHSPTGAVVAYTLNRIVIQGYDESGGYVSITVAGTSGPIQPGIAYTTTDFTNNAQMQYKPDFMGQTLYTSLSSMDGTITFSNVEEGNIEGTFSFVGTNPIDQTSVRVSDGKVEVKN